jgi:hypothetical protein
VRPQRQILILFTPAMRDDAGDAGGVNMVQRDNATARPGGGSLSAVAPTRRPPRADPVASALLLVAGAIGIWQLLLPWRTTAIDASASGTGEVSTTGWQVYRLLRAVPGADAELTAATYSVLGVAVGGGALIVLGLTMMLPINHRPLGFAALLVSVLSVLGACWMLIRARAIFDVGLFGLFAQAQLGWYLFLATGFLGLIGSWKALATG